MCADAAQTDPYFAKSLCGGGAGERAKIWAFSAFLAVFGPLGQFWTNLAKLAIFDNFWDFPNFGQILRDFVFSMFGNFGNFGGFGVNLAALANLGIFGILANLAVFGQLRQFWQFQTKLAILEIFPILVKF